MRAVSVAFSPGRPSRLKNEPGIFPVAYIRSSTSTVSGRKSTSRRLPATAVQRTIVSPWRTTTAPEACLAILPVSNEISLPAISAEIRVTASLLIFTAFLFRPSVGGPFLFSHFPNQRSLADGNRRPRRLQGTAGGRPPSGGGGLAEGALHALAQQLRPGQVPRRRRLVAPAHNPVGAGDHERALGKAALVEHPEGRAGGALGLEVRELLAAHPQLLLEGRLRPARVAGDAVQHGPPLGQLAQERLIQLQRVGANGAEGQ